MSTVLRICFYELFRSRLNYHTNYNTTFIICFKAKSAWITIANIGFRTYVYLFKFGSDMKTDAIK